MITPFLRLSPFTGETNQCYTLEQLVKDSNVNTGDKFAHLYYNSTIAVICVTKSRTGNYDFRACARARGFPGSTVFGRTHTLRRVCRAITR